MNGRPPVQSSGFDLAPDVITREVAKVLRWQVRLTAVSMLLGSILVSPPLIGLLLALAGGMLAILPGLLYAKLAYARRRVAPQVLLKAHFRAEAAKLLLTIALFVVVLLVFKSVSAPALLGAFVLAQAAYWISLLST